MYPYDENNNFETNENETTSENTGSGADAEPSAEDGSYRMVRPDAGKSFDASERAKETERDPGYRDANYTSENTGPAANFYSPSTQRKAEKPKKQRRGMPAAAIVALCLVCALVGGGFGGVIANSLNDDATPPTSLTQEPAPATSGSTVSDSNSGEMSRH